MRKKRLLYFILISFITLISCLIIGSKIQAQLWQPLPPYNVLWPLFSPILSPPDPVTGLPTPLVSTLDANTWLPSWEPCFVWDPSLPFFHLLYSDLTGRLIYYDPIGLIQGTSVTGFSYWPPSTYLDPLGAPIPITLPTNYADLVSFDPSLFLQTWVPITNQLWETTYGFLPTWFVGASDLLPLDAFFFAFYFPLS